MPDKTENKDEHRAFSHGLQLVVAVGVEGNQVKVAVALFVAVEKFALPSVAHFDAAPTMTRCQGNLEQHGPKLA